jgi:hypothetical protein
MIRKAFFRTSGILGALSLILTTGYSQVIHTAAFTKTLTAAGLEYVEPVEQWLHVTMPPAHDFMDYDLVLQDDRNEFEVRYRIHDAGTDMPEVPPAIEVSRLIASIASNKDMHDIHVSIPPSAYLSEVFNADDGLIVRFIPKAEFSEKAYGALWTLYAKGRPAVDVILLYNDPAYHPLTMYRNLRFSDVK